MSLEYSRGVTNTLWGELRRCRPPTHTHLRNSSLQAVPPPPSAAADDGDDGAGGVICGVKMIGVVVV